MYTDDENYKKYLEFVQKQQLQQLLQKYDFDNIFTDLLNSKILNVQELLENGVVEYNLKDLLKDKFILNNVGEIIPPLCCLSDLSNALGIDRKKVAVYKSRNRFLDPSAIVNGKYYWSMNQVKQMATDSKLPECENIFKDTELSVTNRMLSLQEEKLFSLLKEFEMQSVFEDILKSKLLNTEKLLSCGVVQYNLQELLSEGYTINNIGEIIPPLYNLSNLCEETGIDRRKAASYKGKKEYRPSAIINGRYYWSANQIKIITGKSTLSVMEKRMKEKELKLKSK